MVLRRSASSDRKVGTVCERLVEVDEEEWEGDDKMNHDESHDTIDGTYHEVALIESKRQEYVGTRCSQS